MDVQKAFNFFNEIGKIDISITIFKGQNSIPVDVEIVKDKAFLIKM